MAKSLHTHLMFQNGLAQQAIRRYEEIFDDSPRRRGCCYSSARGMRTNWCVWAWPMQRRVRSVPFRRGVNASRRR